MAKRKRPKSPRRRGGRHDGPPGRRSIKRELPTVESPPLSPAGEIAATPPSAAEPIDDGSAYDRTCNRAGSGRGCRTAADMAALCLRPRHKRYGVLAASVTFAAALGAVIGALASGGASTPAKPDVAAVEQNKAMQQSIAKLDKEIAALKASLDAGNKSAHTQIAKISERLEHQAAEITGSIAAPQTVAAAPMPTGAAAAPGAALRGRVAAGAHAGGGELDHPRHAQRLRLCGEPRRDLSSPARRAAARARPGAIDQAAGRPLGGADAEGHHRVACATGAISKNSERNTAPKLNWRRPRGAAFHLCVSGQWRASRNRVRFTLPEWRG